MSIEFIIIIGAVVMALPLSRAIERKAAQERAERAGIQGEKIMNDEKVREIIRSAYLSLKKQGACGYGPWIASIMTRAGEDRREVTAGMAIQAIKKTREDLAGSRFDLSALETYENELRRITE